ncbi:unnamed protein product [Alternaria alternata]|uniref:Fungal N-terminal domain-containing protein n=2 Tax=Alternaria sect. Alternaria TaxID=2499237 RepID=A0AB37WF46_9PLEO|nr:hypothetical protein AA0115_g6819 [Alternaria tenuissima]
MEIVASTPVNAASAVIALNKAAWTLSVSLSELDKDAKLGNASLENLTGEVKSLGNECYQIHLKLVEVASKTKIGSPPPYDGDGRMWTCLTTQVEDASQTIHGLESFVKSVRLEEAEEASLVFRPQRLVQLNKSKDQIEEMVANVRRHSDNLRTTLLLVHTVLAHLVSVRPERPPASDVVELQHMVTKLQRSSRIGPTWRYSHTEATLMQYAQEVIVKEMKICERNPTVNRTVQALHIESNDDRVPQWAKAIQAIREDQQESRVSSVVPAISSKSPGRTYSVLRSLSPIQNMQQHEASDSDDDLDTDFAKAALSTGSQAFDAGIYEEADSLLQEALRILLLLQKRRRAFCDVFSLHYKLAVCAYHVQGPADAEKALTGFVEQSANSDTEREWIHNATHLLAQLYVRMNFLDRARIECEKTLQARRRLQGKQSAASLESMALMAHIYVLLDNRALAKSCLAMIPEANRETVLRVVEESLGKNVEHLDFASLLSRVRPVDADTIAERAHSSRLSTTTLESSLDHNGSDSASVMTKSHVADPWHTPRSIASENVTLSDSSPRIKKSHPSVSSETERGFSKDESQVRDYSPSIRKADVTVASSSEPEYKGENKAKPLSRKEILNKVGCQPRDRAEEAVCDGDYGALMTTLNKKKGFWRSNVRKRGRTERVTALHFAALFGEVDMARALIQAGFGVNEVPFGYSTTLTPLNFAIGARQVIMVDLLTMNGAVPASPDTWSTLAGQLMSRSWLMKTMSEAEKHLVPKRITEIMDILLHRGWDINAPITASGGTVLHQAVCFWTGAYKWDLSLRAAVTSFLCERGANPFQANSEGKTPYDIASASEHQDLMVIIEDHSRQKRLLGTPAMPVELPGQSH